MVVNIIDRSEKVKRYIYAQGSLIVSTHRCRS